MSVTVPADIYMAVPSYTLDQILGTFTGSISVGAGSGLGPKIVTDTRIHNFGDSCYFQGVFSTDNGTTWNDFGAMIPDMSNPSSPVFQTIDCIAYTDTTNAYIDAINYLNSSQTVLYKLFLIARNTMAKPVSPLPTVQGIAYSSKYNFQRIAYKGLLPLSVSAGNTGSVTFVHNLGYVPSVRAFWFNAGSPTCYPITYSPSLGVNQQGADNAQIELTSTALTVYTDQGGTGIGINGTVEYRIYL